MSETRTTLNTSCEYDLKMFNCKMKNFITPYSSEFKENKYFSSEVQYTTMPD